MLKKVVSVCLAAGLCLGLFGCSNGSDSAGGADGKKVTVNVWNHNASMKELQQELIDKFNAENSDIEIVLNLVADKYNDVLNMAMSSEEDVDIFSVSGPSLTKKAADLGWAEPLDDYMTPEFKAMFKDNVWVENNNVIKGKTYVLPDQASTYRMIYNKDLFRQAGLDPENPPKTYDEFRQAVKQITETGGADVKGFAMALADSYYLDVDIFNGLGYSSFGTLQGYDYSKGTFDFSVFKPAIELFRNIRADGSMLEGELLLKPDQVRSKFAEGKIGIMGAASWEASTYATLAPAFEVGIANWPTADGEIKGKNTIQIGSGFAMSANTEDKETTWKVLEFLASPEFSGEINRQAGNIGVYKDEAVTTEYANKYVEGFLPNETDGMWPAVVPSLALQGDNRTVVFTRLIAEESVDIDAELQDLTDRTNAAFNKAIEDGDFAKEDYVIEGFDPTALQ